MPYRVFKESDGYAVWKVSESGEKLERKNKKGYKSHAEAMPFMRKLYSVENASLEVQAEQSAMDFEEEVTPQTVTASTELVLGSVHLEADADNPRFLRFHDAVLARAETNANRDDLDEDSIQELAATIGGTPIDVEHDGRKNIGFFTAGRAENGALKVDGVAWVDRCAALGIDPADIETGKYRLSIEAEAKTAECSVCHSVHTDISTYCQHLKAKAIHGAKRILRGLKAVGGAITKTPAGSETVFSTIFMVASHQEESETDETQTVEAVDKREDVSDSDKERAEKEYGDVKYADEKNKKYPIDTEEHARAALSYFSMPKNSGKYSPEERKAIMSKIRRAAKKFGVEVSDDENKSESSMTKECDMDDEHKPMMEETPEEEKKEEKNETEANYAKMQADLAALSADLEAKKADLANEQTAKTALEAKVTDLEARVQTLEAALQTARSEVKASRVATLKQQLVGSVMTEDEFKADEDRLVAMDEATIGLLIKAAMKRESTDGKKPENRVIASETAPDNGRVKFVL